MDAREELKLIVGYAQCGLIANELGKQVKLEQIIKIANGLQPGMTQGEYDTLLKRIEDGLSKASDPKQTMFWQGFIVSLCDYGVIDFRIFRNLLDTISCWKKGDTTSRMVPITDLPTSH